MPTMTREGVAYKVRGYLVETADGDLILLKPGKGRSRKAKKTTAVSEPAALPTQKSGRRRGFFRRRPQGELFEVNINECVGLADYLCKGEPKTLAVYRTGTDDSGRWYSLLFINEDNTKAYNNGGAFKAKHDKLSNIMLDPDLMAKHGCV